MVKKVILYFEVPKKSVYLHPKNIERYEAGTSK